MATNPLTPPFEVPASVPDAVRHGFRSQAHLQRLGDRFFRRRERLRLRMATLDEEDAIWSERCSVLLAACGVPLAEQELRDAIQNYLALMAFQATQGHCITGEECNREINRIAEEHGYLSGVPIPDPRESRQAFDLVMASGVPLAELFHMNQEHRRHLRTEMEGDILDNAHVRNSWDMLGDRTVCVIDTNEGPMAYPRWHAGGRLRKLIRGNEVRFHAGQRAEAEMKALESLRGRISNTQYESYVLSGLFPERSKRSDIWYFFRKGYPTIAVSFHDKHDVGKVLCTLCLHPMGYYQGTHVGLMVPTDEVIAHLLMMRADEHKFWAKSGQWRAEDPRSGL